MKFLSKLTLTLAVFTLTTSSTLAFSDVPDGIWYEEAVNRLEEEGMIDSGNFFRPEDELNRAELVKLVVERAGLLKGWIDFEMPNSPTFLDVSLNKWFSPHVEVASKNGIIAGFKDEQGIPTGYFKPEGIATRAEMIKMIVESRNLSLPCNISDPNFYDVNEGDWFYEYVKIAYNNRVIEGYPDESFKPNQAVKRSEAAHIIFNSLETSFRLPQDVCEHLQEPVTEVPTPPQEPVTEPAPPAEQPPVTEVKFVPNNTSLSPRIIGGNETHLAAVYYFQASKEGFYIQTLTISNDIVGENIGDEPQGSFAVNQIILKYPNKDGFLRTATAPLSSNGKTTFGGLEFFAPKDKSVPLEIYIQTEPFSGVGAQLSGETIRLGVQNINNTNAEFKAIGEFSGSVIQGGNSPFSYFESYKMVVREGGAPLLKTLPIAEHLFSGENELIRFALESPTNTLGLARITLELSIYDSANADLTLNDFKLRDSSGVVDEAVIYDTTGNQDLSAGSLGNGTYQLVISFNQEQVISSNKEYYLTANVSSSSSNDSITTRIKRDESPLSGLTASFQENTGKIYSEADSTTGIFTGTSDFSQTAGANLNFIWSDRSGEPHQYPTVNAGVVTNNTGSSDWTNGHLLNMDEAKTQVLSK